ncbi:MAG: Tfp pilus assembly protein FimT/FimU [Mariprofundus sp.]
MSARTQRGFTLIELMIAVVIIAVLVTIGVPAFSDWRAKQSVRSGAQALMAHMKQARVLALSENRSVSITFTSTSYIFDADTSGSCGLCRKETTSLSQFSSSMSLSPTTTRTFTSRGTANSGSVVLTASGHSKTITLNVIGRAYLQ